MARDTVRIKIFMCATVSGMALFGMVWLLRVRSEMKRCAKCRRQQQQQQQQQQDVNASLTSSVPGISSLRTIAVGSSEEYHRTGEEQMISAATSTTFFTIDTPVVAELVPSAGGTMGSPGHLGPTTYCEVHGYTLPKEDIQEFYELTLLDETKSVQEKTAETIRIANKWETNDGPIAPTYTNNDFIVLAAALLTAHHASAGYVPAGPFLAPRGVHHVAPAAVPVAVAPVPAPIPHYTFAYDVKDSLTGDFKSQVESRTGDVVQGRYTVLDPDGHKRVVHYTADPVHGFNAVVSRIPIVVAAPPPLVAGVAPGVVPVAPPPAVVTRVAPPFGGVVYG